MVAGSIGSLAGLGETTPETAASACDIVEIRLDLLAADGWKSGSPWSGLQGLPILFTARRKDEGGAGSLDAATRMQLLESVLDDAACVDIEVASIGEMSPILATLAARNIPWIASFHNFETLPETRILEAAAARAREAGAICFKAAAMLKQPEDLARLANFQLADHGIPKATMGMGPMAPVSRLLCAQCGSRVNYGYLGQTTTAPGQWSAATLREAISRLAAVHP